MVSKKYWDDIVQRMKKQKNNTKYEALLKSHTKEDEIIKFHLAKIESYFKLTPEDKDKTLYIGDCSASIRAINSYFDSNGWE